MTRHRSALLIGLLIAAYLMGGWLIGGRVLALLVDARSASGQIDIASTVGNQPPIARFTMTSGSQSATENQTLSLNVAAGAKATVSSSATRSTDPDGIIAQYEWRISGTLVSVARDFTFTLGSGRHDVLLTVRDNGGLTGSVGAAVDVNVAPIALFTMSSGRTSATENQTLNVAVPPARTADIAFSAGASLDPDGGPLTYRWSIDGSVVGRLPDFTLALAEGAHQVLLTVVDERGAQGSAGGTIVIERLGTPPPATPQPAAAGRPRQIILVPGIRLFEAPGSVLRFPWTVLHELGYLESEQQCVPGVHYKVRAWTQFSELIAFLGLKFLPIQKTEPAADIAARFNFRRDDFKAFNYNPNFNTALPTAPTEFYTCFDTQQRMLTLAELFDRQFTTFMKDGADFDVVAHSLGGAVVAYWAGGLTPQSVPGDLKKLKAIHSFIAFSSPLRGLGGIPCADSAALEGAAGDAGLDLCEPQVKERIAAGLRLLSTFAVNNPKDVITDGVFGNGQTVGQGLLWHSEHREWSNCESFTNPHESALCMTQVNGEVRSLVRRAVMNDFYDARTAGDRLGSVTCSALFNLAFDEVRGDADLSIQGTLMESSQGGGRCQLTFDDAVSDGLATDVIWHTWDGHPGRAGVLVDSVVRCDRGCPIQFGVNISDPVRVELGYKICTPQRGQHSIVVVREPGSTGSIGVDGFEVIRSRDRRVATTCP